MNGTLDVGQVVAICGIIGLVVAAVWKLTLHIFRRVEDAEQKASDGDRRLHQRIDDVAAGAITRAELVQHLEGIADNVNHVRTDITALRTGMENLANAVIAGRARGGRAMIRTLALILLLAGCAATPAEPPVPVSTPGCGSRSDILAALESQYGERTVSIGLAEGGVVVEVTASEDGTWTLLGTGPGGVTCIILVGQGWHEVKKGRGV